jgi:hypothetical protein
VPAGPSRPAELKHRPDRKVAAAPLHTLASWPLAHPGRAPADTPTLHRAGATSFHHVRQKRLAQDHLPCLLTGGGPLVDTKWRRRYSKITTSRRYVAFWSRHDSANGVRDAAPPPSVTDSPVWGIGSAMSSHKMMGLRGKGGSMNDMTGAQPISGKPGADVRACFSPCRRVFRRLGWGILRIEAGPVAPYR